MNLIRHIFFATIFLLLSPCLSAQHVVKFKPVALYTLSDNFGANYGIGLVGYEYLVNDKISVGMDLDLVILTLKLSSISIFGISNKISEPMVFFKPQFKYHITDSSPAGAYAGAYFDIGVGGFDAVFMGFGVKGGYQHLFLNDRLGVFGEIELGPGFTFSNGESGAGFKGVTPAVGLSYVFR